MVEVDYPQTSEAIHTVAVNIRELDDPTVPDEVTSFAGFFADWVDRLPGNILPPHVFITQAGMMILSLKRGTGPMSEPLDHPLVGKDAETYGMIMTHIPMLGRIGVSEAYGDEVHRQMLEYGVIPAPEASEKPVLDETEIINDPVTNIYQAEEYILVDALLRTQDVYWQNYGVEPDTIEQTYGKHLSHLLNTSAFVMPIKFLSDEKRFNSELLSQIQPNNKRPVHSHYWLAMIEQELPADYAMATRDFLFLKLVELVAQENGMEPDGVVRHLMKDIDGTFGRAATRMVTYQREHPEHFPTEE